MSGLLGVDFNDGSDAVVRKDTGRDGLGFGHGFDTARHSLNHETLDGRQMLRVIVAVAAKVDELRADLHGKLFQLFRIGDRDGTLKNVVCRTRSEV